MIDERSAQTFAQWGWSMLLLGALAACGGGGSDNDSGSAAASDAAATAVASAADHAMPSDSAQPHAADPPIYLSDGTLAKNSSRQQALHALPEPVVDDPAAIDVGEFLFKDERLSASGRMSCATCHAETFGHADAPGVSLPKGGPGLDLAGSRSSMTARYLNLTPPFRLSRTGTPSGGYLWDGRADSRFEQAFHGSPFFNAIEMALPGSTTEPQAVTDRVRSAPYWPGLQALYVGREDLISTDRKLFRQIGKLLEIYQRGDADYNLFDSRFDAVRAGRDSLTSEEARGWALFSDRTRGNCVACHSASLDEPAPLLTNFGYAALGVPRNHAAPPNSNVDFYDLGLCAREKAPTQEVNDSAVRVARYCGLFKTPTLRNVERTAPYFHNASVSSLEQAVRFHFEREAYPGKWYRKADGSRDRNYNDLPRPYRDNLARGKPFNGTFLPSDSDVADLLAFLRTLNDADQTEPLPVGR